VTAVTVIVIFVLRYAYNTIEIVIPRKMTAKHPRVIDIRADPDFAKGAVKTATPAARPITAPATVKAFASIVFSGGRPGCKWLLSGSPAFGRCSSGTSTAIEVSISQGAVS
jgi:hypothetical protein